MEKLSNCSRLSQEKLYKARFSDVDANARLLAGAMDGILVHSKFLSTKAKEQVQTNIVFANSMAEQRNHIKVFTDNLAHVGDVHGELKDDINGVQTEMQQIENSIKTEMRSGQNELKNMLMSLMQNSTTVAASTPAAPATPAALAQTQQTQHQTH
jgi:hypothetical protein